ncbi:phosphoglycerate dehydrogenase [Enemella evansiae]|uniref:NAD(P)-dependent oxidoreductase n=1 Tax=Enemella evansiae TaxID=2016499 RepID=UPI000B96092B|nr:NAD(P)-dependent oxidoreductase [Enemella evansiae]OYO15562.1 phosphoglycerate dehydrogenase [Enemella evansiae]
MKVLLPDTLTLDPELPAGWEAVGYSRTEPIPDEHRDAEALVTWGVSADLLAEHARTLPRLRLAQSLAAGPDSLLRAGFADEVVLTGGAGLHSATVSEHALALLLDLVCRLPQAAAAQREHRWAAELGGVRALHPEGPIATLLQAKVLIWGFGQIAQHLTPLLQALGAEVRGVARSAGTRAGVEVVADSEVESALEWAEVLIMILPDTPESRHALNADRLARLSPDAFLINVGRGSTLDEAALAEALVTGRLAGAAIDVTETEPLPADSPLWEVPKLVITPHAAGGRPVGADELIAVNLRALSDGSAYRNQIERSG